MGLKKITFEGANVTSKFDADLHHFLFSNKIGVLDGLKNSVSYTLANNTITFKDGYVSIYGKLVYVEEGTNIAVTPDSSKFGYVILAVNSSENSVSLYTKEAVGTYPYIIRNNLIIGDGLYELPLCAYIKTTTSVTLDNTYTRDVIKSTNEQIEVASQSIYNSISMQRLNTIKVTNGTYKITGLNSVDLEKSLLIIPINNSKIVTLPGQLIFEQLGSFSSVQYQYLGIEYILAINFSSNTTTFNCGDNSHVIDFIYIYR